MAIFCIEVSNKDRSECVEDLLNQLINLSKEGWCVVEENPFHYTGKDKNGLFTAKLTLTK